MPRNGSGIYSKPSGTTFVPNTVIESAKVNEVIDDLVADANAARPITAGGTGATNATNARANLGVPESVASGVAFKGMLFGLTLANNATDATNDIDVAAGAAASDSSTPVVMTLASSLTKRLDAAWAVGSGNGGLDTGAIANTSYHVWLIQRSDTGVVDALFSTSATSPTMPSGYDRKRRIGSIIRSAGAILGFDQTGDLFTLNINVTNVSTSSAVALTALAVTVPAGIVVRPVLQASIIKGTAGDGTLFLVNPLHTNPTVSLRVLNASDTNSTTTSDLYTNTSSQIQYQVTAVSGTITESRIVTSGWYDSRGKE